jgi:hypothetical protein
MKSNELKSVNKLNTGGLSQTDIYSAKYKGKNVIIKVNNAENDNRFMQELDILKSNIDGVVNMIGYGDDFNGAKFIALEDLCNLPAKLSEETMREYIYTIISASRKLYLRGFNWVCSKKHIMVDSQGNIKLIDFNDDNYEEPSFVYRQEYYNIFVFCGQLCDKYGYNPTTILQDTMNRIVEEEYQSLKNVHEPIYFEPYNQYYRMETEKDDPNYMKLVPPNRVCIDRAEIIMNNIKHLKGNETCLDIGCNTGWFTFLMQNGGLRATGIDFDKEKIEFNKMVSDLQESEATFEFADVNLGYVKQMPKYDIILALSILHLYFTQHNVTKEYWIELFRGICDKTRKILIFEVSANIFKNVSVGNFGELAELAKNIGGFSTVNVAGKSDANRPLIICKR